MKLLILSQRIAQFRVVVSDGLVEFVDFCGEAGYFARGIPASFVESFGEFFELSLIISDLVFKL